METKEKPTRKRGRPSGTALSSEKYTLMLDPEYAEWGKEQPGGLSELVRRLLKEARENVEAHTKPEKEG